MKPFSSYRAVALRAYAMLGCSTKDELVITRFRLSTRFASDGSTHVAAVELFHDATLLVDSSIHERRIADLETWTPPGFRNVRNAPYIPPFPREPMESSVANVAAYLCGQLGTSRSEANRSPTTGVSLTVDRQRGFDELRSALVFLGAPADLVRIHILDPTELTRAKRFDQSQERP